MRLPVVVGMFCMLILDCVWLTCSLFAYDLMPPSSQWEYHLGQGLRVGNTGLTLGGYGSVRYEDLYHQSPQLTIGALSMFLSWDTGTRVRFFSETELEDLTVARGDKSFETRNHGIQIERLYADIYLFETATLRLGKFLTPVGRWNLIHADPLVWTTSRPLVTFQPFAPNTTGAMLYGNLQSLGKDLEYSVYLEFTDDLDSAQDEGPFNEAIGIHLATSLGPTEIGFSYAHFDRGEEHDEQQNLFGLDFLWIYRQLEVTGEFVYRVGIQGPDKDEWGLFVQGTVPLIWQLFAVARYEFFAPQGPFPGVHLWIPALAFRPIPPLVVRAEYSFAYDNVARVPQGFSSSVALLF